MLLALCLSPAHRFCHTLFTTQLLFAQVLFLLHRLQAVLHATKVRLLTVGALKEGALVEGKRRKLLIVVVTWRHHSALLVVTFLLGHLDGLSHDLVLECEAVKELLRQDWHLVINHYLLLAAWTIEEAERDSQGGPAMEHHLPEAIRVEDVAAD